MDKASVDRLLGRLGGDIGSRVGEAVESCQEAQEVRCTWDCRHSWRRSRRSAFSCRWTGWETVGTRVRERARDCDQWWAARGNYARRIYWRGYADDGCCRSEDADVIRQC